MTVIGYPDRDAINRLSAIEVVSVLVSSLGAPSPTDSPASTPVTIGISNVRIAPVPGTSGLRLTFDFPASYANRFRARFLSSEDTTHWEALPEAVHSRGTFAHGTFITTPQFHGTVCLRPARCICYLQTLQSARSGASCPASDHQP